MARSTNFQVKLEDFLTNLLSKNYREPAQAAWLKCEISLLKDSFIKALVVSPINIQELKFVEVLK